MITFNVQKYSGSLMIESRKPSTSRRLNNREKETSPDRRDFCKKRQAQRRRFNRALPPFDRVLGPPHLFISSKHKSPRAQRSFHINEYSPAESEIKEDSPLVPQGPQRAAAHSPGIKKWARSQLKGRKLGNWRAPTSMNKRKLYSAWIQGP